MAGLGTQNWKNVFDKDWDHGWNCSSLFARFPVAVLANF